MDLWRLFAQLQTSGFQDVAGTRVSARLPISSALLNQGIDEALRGTSSPVQSVRVRPAAGDRFEAVVTTSMPFVPALTVHIAVDRQPTLPDFPFLVFRWSFLGGLGAFASRFVGALERKLPPGIRLDGDLIVLELRTLATRLGPPGAVDWLRYLLRLEVHTDGDRTVIDIEAAIP